MRESSGATKMRVVHVLCDLSGGGAERVVLDLCRQKVDGLEPEVIAVFEGGSLEPAFADAGIVVRCARRRRGGIGLSALARMRRWCRGADVVHTHLWAGDVWGRLAALMAGVSVVVSTEHGMDPLEPGWKQQVKRKTQGLTSCTVAVSNAVRDWCVARGVPAERLVVIPNGVDLTRFQSGPQPAGPRPRVLGIGRLSWEKGFDVLIEACRDLKDVSLEIVGEGPMRDALEAMGNGQVRFHGELEEVAEVMKGADLVVVPSRSEGFGLVALEAMAAGVPVIASSIGGLPDLLGDAGLLVPPGDELALREAIRALLADAPRRADMTAKGHSLAHSLSLEAMCQAYTDLYQSLVSR